MWDVFVLSLYVLSLSLSVSLVLCGVAWKQLALIHQLIEQ